MIIEEAISVIREHTEDPTWELTLDGVRDAERALYYNDLHIDYVDVLNEIAAQDKDWTTVNGRSFWSITASLEERAKSVALVLSDSLDSKSKSASS